MQEQFASYFCIVNRDITAMQVPKFPRISHYFEEDLTIRSFYQMKTLGKGTFGQVKLCKHLDTGEQYAIKKINLNPEDKTNLASESYIENLTRKELEILYRVDNRHVIKLLDHFEDRDTVYLITEYIKGSNLYEQSLKIKKVLPTETIADIIYQICEALEQLHSNHIIHRDIKLENVMFDGKNVKIVDLGCSNFYGEAITRHTMVGTKIYWSPELILQEQQNDKVDVWCVGVILFQLLYLQEPFPLNEIEKKIRKLDYVFPHGEEPQADLRDLFKKVFTYKNNRLKASELKRHPWVRKYRQMRETKARRFQNFFSERQAEEYLAIINDSIESSNQYLELIRDRSNLLEILLRESKKELKRKEKQLKEV